MGIFRMYTDEHGKSRIEELDLSAHPELTPPVPPQAISFPERAPGDIVLLCTDGIVEAVDRDGKPFGEERLRQIIRSARNDTAEQLVRQIGTAVEAFYEGDGPSDDLTVLGLRRVD